MAVTDVGNREDDTATPVGKQEERRHCQKMLLGGYGFSTGTTQRLVVFRAEAA